MIVCTAIFFLQANFNLFIGVEKKGEFRKRLKVERVKICHSDPDGSGEEYNCYK